MTGSKTKILAIDDNADNLVSLKALINDAFPDIDVITALNGLDGIDLAIAKEPDVILLDILMPGMDGFEVCRKLKIEKATHEIPVVFVTAVKEDKENRVRALECGAEAFLSKPIDEIELTAQIRAMLKIRAANTQKRDENQWLTALVEEKTRELKNSNIELTKLVEAVKRDQALIQSIFDSIPGYLYVYDESGKLIKWNKKHETMTGYTAAELSHMTLEKWFDCEDIIKVKAAVHDVFEKGYSEVEAQLILKNRERMMIRSSGVPLILDGQKYFAGIGIDITDRKRAESELIYLSSHDHLTGLYNRKFFEDELKRLDTTATLPLSIIMCDVNGLKLINDSFGHNNGDRLLVKVAKAIRTACGVNGFVSRIGGDEFAVILPRTGAGETAQIANKIKQLASKENIKNIELSVSYGHDTKTNNKQKIIEVLANAENHMYKHKLYERSSTRSKTIDIIMNTLFEKSKRESMHSNRVGAISQAIASKMVFNKDDVNQMRIAGLIHDIGKIGIDEKILNKSGSLSGDEWEQIKKHPEIGWRILGSAIEFSELADIVLAHHERWDGKGYPNGLKGEKIPLEARIIAVADAFDAMTSQRSYRIGITQEEAIHELKRCSGTQFDPEIVEVFVEKVVPYNSFS